MRRVVIGLLLAIALVPVTAQRPTGPPTFEPGDTDGLVTSPNPRIRHAWKRRVFWKTFSEPGRGTFWVMDACTLDYFDPFVLPDRTPLGRYPLTFDTGVFPFYHSDVETRGTWAMSVKGETESAYSFFNRLPESFDTSPLLTEARPGDRPPEPL